MQALLVGGPLNGRVMEIEPERSKGVVVEDVDGTTYIYDRRAIYTHAGKELILFVTGDLAYEKVREAIQISDLTETGKRRILTPNLEGILDRGV